MTVHYAYVDSPLGPLLTAADDHGLRLLEFPDARHPCLPQDDWLQAPHPVLSETQRQLDLYFAGSLQRFDLPLAPQGTAFQVQVWLALADIPYGDTISYTTLAIQVGRPNAVRAVGGANGRNPLGIVLPCHRVIGSDGSLTGFGGGLPAKQFLLRLEGALPDSPIRQGLLFD